MDKIDKALAKIPHKQRQQVLVATAKIIANDLTGLDVKKIKGLDSLFRVRIGNYRLVFNKLGPRHNLVIMIAKRDEKTYKDL